MKTITLPADIFESKAVIALSYEFGRTAQTLIVMILCEIAQNGYFIRWDNLQRNFLARNIDLMPNILDRIVMRLVEYGYFDAAMFNKNKVLTSLDIQKRYFRSKKRREQIASLPNILPQILAKYNVAKSEPTGEKSEFSGASGEKIIENADKLEKFERAHAPIIDQSSQNPPSKTKIIRYFSGIIKADAKTVRERALAFYEQAKAAKWRFTDPVTRYPLTWQQAADRTVTEERTEYEPIK